MFSVLFVVIVVLAIIFLRRYRKKGDSAAIEMVPKGYHGEKFR